MREKIFELTLWAIFIVGILKAYLLPAISLLIGIKFIHIPDWISTPGIGHVMTIFMGVLPLISILNFYLHGGKLQERRPRIIHWIYLALMIFGAFFAPLERIFIRGNAMHELWVLSDTLPSGIAFGLLIPFYKLEKEKKLLLFLLPFAFFYLGVPFAAAAKILNPTLKGLPTYETPFYLDAWFWSDMIVNIGAGFFIFWGYFRRENSKNK